MSLFASDYSKVIEVPDASAIIKKDLLPPFEPINMPDGCITNDADAIARGAYMFNNLNGEAVKGDAPKGLSKKNADGTPKQYGNCVACHNIEKAVGGGNIGPDLTNYHEVFVSSGVRDAQYVYKKIADARVDNPDTDMTINLTTKLFNQKEICELASYVLSIKK